MHDGDDVVVRQSKWAGGGVRRRWIRDGDPEAQAKQTQVATREPRCLLAVYKELPYSRTTLAYLDLE